MASIAASVFALVILAFTAPALQEDKPQYSSAEEAFRVGAAFHNARSYKNSRVPLETAIRMTQDEDLRLKAYRALLPAYREIPEFEPFQSAAEYIVTHSHQSAERSLVRNAFLSFAFNRGQMDNLTKRYEEILKKDPNHYTAVYILSEIYRSGDKNPQRAIELMKQLEKLEKKKDPATSDKAMSTADQLNYAREKAKLASQYVKSKDYKKAAKIYEEIAPTDPTTRAWNLKEAASAWMKDNNRTEAARLANLAAEAEPEKRNDQLTHFFHRNLGDLFLQLDQPKKAIPHFEIAIQKTNIDGYIKGTKSSLAEAIEKSKSKD